MPDAMDVNDHAVMEIIISRLNTCTRDYLH
jgi:hypothetical protein